MATKAKRAEINASNGSFVSMSSFQKEKEPEMSSINFKESLRFFEEQLVINSNKETASVNGIKTRRRVNSKRSSTESLDIPKSPDINDEVPNYTGSKIQPIPTVDSILQSVKILRAIQKSQAQRVPNWSLEEKVNNSDVLGPFKALEFDLTEFDDIKPLKEDSDEFVKKERRFQTEFDSGIMNSSRTQQTLLKDDTLYCLQEKENRFWPTTLCKDLTDKVIDSASLDNGFSETSLNDVHLGLGNNLSLSSKDSKDISVKPSLEDMGDFVPCSSLELVISERSTSAEIDSGMGTDKSVGSLSPMRCELDPEKDLWSESYPSAEGSPCGSLMGIAEDSEVPQPKLTDDVKNENSDFKTIQNSSASSQENDIDSLNSKSDCVKEEKNFICDNVHTTFNSISAEPPDKQDEIVTERLDNKTVGTLKGDDNVFKDRLIEVVEDRLEQVEFQSIETTLQNKDDSKMPEQSCDFDTLHQDTCGNTNDNRGLNGNKAIRTDLSLKEPNLPSEILVMPDSLDFQRPDSSLSKSTQKNLYISTSECIFSGSESSLNTLQTELADEDEPHRSKKKVTVSWDPVPLLELLYDMKDNAISKPSNEFDEIKESYLQIQNISGFDITNETLYAVFKENNLYLYQTEQKKNLLAQFPLKYATTEVIDDNILLLDNRLGQWLTLLCTTEDEVLQWKNIIQSHSKCVELDGYLEPVNYPLQFHKNVLIIDLGSCSTRAGILMDHVTYPTLFFPTVCATDKKTGNQTYGIEALLPDVRKNSVLSFPARPSAKVTKFTMDIDSLSGLFKMIFNKLKIDPKNFTVQLCIPRSLSTDTQIALVKLLLEDLGVQAISFTRQALLTMYANNKSTAIVVDIGDRMEILPVVDGFILEGGVSKLPYGGQRIFHHMKHALAQKHISLSSNIETFVVQYIFEKLCYIAQNYDEELDAAMSKPESVRKSVPLFPYFHDDLKLRNVSLDIARFQVPEGIFNPDLWGLDSPGLHKLIHHAIKSSGMDVRRKMAENIYISGGVTLLPGFVERLQKEIAKLTLPRITPKVHASPYRYHMTYFGACQLAKSDAFPQVCITAKEWLLKGPTILNRWHL